MLDGSIRNPDLCWVRAERSGRSETGLLSSSARCPVGGCLFSKVGGGFGGFAPNLHAISTLAPNGAKFICFLWGVAPGPKYIIISLKSVSPGFKEMQKQGKHIYHLN